MSDFLELIVSNKIKMSLAEIIFWFSILSIGIVYGGYFLLCQYIVSYRKLDVRSDPDYEPTISLIIPTWNEENTIKGKLENTLDLEYPKDKLEVLIIDDGSNDKTVEIVKGFIKNHRNFKLLKLKERRGKAVALNRALRYSNGEIIVITDSDSRLNKNILNVSIPYFADQRVGALTGRHVVLGDRDSDMSIIEIEYRNLYHMIRHAESILDSTFIFNGPFTAFRKTLISRIYNDSVADDSEIALRIRQKGYRTIHVDDAIFWEFAASSMQERTKQKYRRAQGLIQLFLRFFKVFFFNRNYGLFGMLIFPIEFFMHVISPFLILLFFLTFFSLHIHVALILLTALLLLSIMSKSRYIIITFLHSQYSCLKGLFTYIFRGPSYSWEKIEGTRRYKQ
ncbi:MAG: hypothetical protein DRO76_00020 [Candidatus Altiarchaeales archaeon]|nr:MAG: hypothetical protein DRP84_08960 [Spirochaetota bacterium]RLI88482.1 MAG: hypothetical protein DRO76_00020 [Candidatus Altiarchaeales archaeon]